jgi:hypothetical protein
MSGDAGLDEKVIFYHRKMTEAKKIVLQHKGIELAYMEINSQKVNDSLKRQRSLDKTL